MPNLGDYLGQLLSEISIARMHADLETVRLAELYAEHPLLRTLPVPHVRLPVVELDVPVLVESSPDSRAEESARGGVKLEDMARKFGDVLDARLSQAGVALTAADRKRVQSALDGRLALRGVPIEVAVDVSGVANDLSETALRAMDELKATSRTPKPVLPEGFAADLKATVRREFLALRTPPSRLSVRVTSAEIRDDGTPESVIRLHLSASEAGLEWTTVGPEGEQQDRLVPE